jgi:uncharacterized membrane protein HdeD (DUF308 family)
MSIAAGMLPSIESRTPLKIAAVITIILGILALVMPFIAGVAATYILVANFVIAGLGTVAFGRADRSQSADGRHVAAGVRSRQLVTTPGAAGTRSTTRPFRPPT